MSLARPQPPSIPVVTAWSASDIRFRRRSGRRNGRGILCSAVKRNGGSKRCSAPAWADNFEPTGKYFYAVLETDQSGPAADHRAADPIVADRQKQISVSGAGAYGDLGCARILGGVGQGFCHDVVRSDFNLFRHPGFHADIKFNGYC